MDRFSEFFSFPVVAVTKKYQTKSKYIKKHNKIQKKICYRTKMDTKIIQELVGFLQFPIQHWALLHQQSISTSCFCQWLFSQLIKLSPYYTKQIKQNNPSHQQDPLKSQQKQTPSIKPVISLHNVFLLMTHYKVLQKTIQHINTQELQMIIDGICQLYLYTVRNVNHQQMDYAWGTMDELTCCIHYIITHTKYHSATPINSNSTTSTKLHCKLMKDININNMTLFIQSYSCFQSTKKIDTIINSILMFMQFLQLFIKYKSYSSGCQFITHLKWLSQLGFRLIQSIQKNINKLLLLNNEFGQALTQQQIQMISQLQNEQNQEHQSGIGLKLTQKALLLKQTQGTISTRILFSYAFNHLYDVNSIIKLLKKVLQLSKHDYICYKQTSKDICCFLHKLFQCVSKFDFNLNEIALAIICQIIQILSSQIQYVYQGQNKQVQGFYHLYGKQIQSLRLKDFTKNLQISHRYGYYVNKLKMPDIYQDQHSQKQLSQQYKVLLQINQQSMFYYIFSSIFNMKLEYFSIILALLQNANKKNLKKLQFYMIKNELLHFMIESQHKIPQKDIRMIRIFYNLLSYLIKDNLVAYAIVDETIILQTDHIKKSNIFINDLNNHFTQLKKLLLIILADSISYNKNHPQYQFCPIILKQLLYPKTNIKTKNQKSIKNTNIASKHEIWICYISNVILHELQLHKKRTQQIQKKNAKTVVSCYKDIIQDIDEKNQKACLLELQMHQWITLIILLHIQHIECCQSQQVCLTQLTMSYLSTMLAQSIKQKKHQSDKIVQFLRLFMNWEKFYTNKILHDQNNRDVFQQEYGGVVRYFLLKRWNGKILKAITIYLQSIYEEQYRRKQQLTKIRSLKNLIS